MQRIVLTGGPCAGKSKVLEHLKKHFNGKLLPVPEVATKLFTEGYPRPGKDVEWSEKWQADFQAAVLLRQMRLEIELEQQATEQGIKIIVCDRGLLDGAAYVPAGREEFASTYKVDVLGAMKSYYIVVHLESTAVGDPGFYSSDNNKSRFETLERAQYLEMTTRAAWCDHPGWRFVSCNLGLAGKVQTVTDMIYRLLDNQKKPELRP